MIISSKDRPIPIGIMQVITKHIHKKLEEETVYSTKIYGNEETSKQSTVWKIVSDKIESTMSN